MAPLFVRCPPRGLGRPWDGPAAGRGSDVLSRTADHLFWMARYMERAENTARMLDVNYQTSLLPQTEATAQQGWRGLLSISELTTPFSQKYRHIDARSVIDFMVRDETNPSSIVSCLRAA